MKYSNVNHKRYSRIKHFYKIWHRTAREDFSKFLTFKQYKKRFYSWPYYLWPSIIL